MSHETKNIQQILIDNPRTTNKIIWQNISDAGKSEIEYLRKKYKFDLKYLQASSGKIFSQRPFVEVGNGYLFMILHFPIIENGEISSGEIDFFMGHGYLITLQNNNLPAFTNFFNSCKKGTNDLLSAKFESSSILLYEILEKLMINCYSLLDCNAIAISEAEKVIFAYEQKNAVSQIMNLKRNIINLRRIMLNHKNILQKLMEMKSAIVPQNILKKHYSGLVEHAKRIWETLENQKEMIDALHDTNASMLNFRISDIMKTLTIFSVIMFPLTLFAAVFGMNTTNGMPFIGTSNGFWIIIAFMTLGSLCMLLFFEKKKWL